MTKPLARLALILVLVSIACSLPVYADPSPTPLAVSQLLVTAGPNSTATPTPFQPIGPTATLPPTATLEPTITNTPEPDAAAIPSLPTPIRISQKMTEGTANLRVLGNDWRPSSGYRTDVILLVSINKGKGTVSIVSFPRDLYVTIPGWGTDRINTAFQRGSFAMMADTFEYN